MAQNRAHVDQAVFDVIRPQLARYRGEAADLTRSVANAMARAGEIADARVSQLHGDLARAQDELVRCVQLCIAQGHGDAVCGGYRQNVGNVEAHLQRARRVRGQIYQTIATFQHSQDRYRTTVDQLLLRAEKIVALADERINNYQQVRQRLSDAGDAGIGEYAAPAPLSWQDLPGVSVPALFPAGFALIPIELITDDGDVPGTADGGAGQDLPALRWSTRALVDVVLPAMSVRTDVLQYLRDRDTREQLSGERCYSATYSNFFSPDSAIRLSPLSDGRFDIVDGQHQLRVMKHAGAQYAPALIAGGLT
jgi:hypothetical protein